MRSGGVPVGRDAEREQLASVLRASAAGLPGAVLVAGEAGIGKTSLVEQVTSGPAAAGHLVLWGRCLRFGADSSPYLPFAQILTQWHRQADAAERRRVLEGAGPLTTIAPSLGAPAGNDDTTAVVPLVATVLDRIAETTPLVVVVDDVQWADGTSLDLLAYLMAGFGEGQPLSVLATYRDTGLGDGHRLHGWLADVLRLPSVSRLRLERLGLAETEELVAGLQGAGGSARLAAEVFERSGGNPYLAQLLVHSHGQDADGSQEAGLRGALLGSWHRLDPGARELLQLLAVGGRPVPVEVLEGLAAARGHDPGGVAGWLADATGEGLVRIAPDGDAWFHHPLVADVVAATVTPASRVAVHREYLEALESAAELSDASRAAHLALHHEGGRNPDQAFRWSLRAADAAAAVLAFAEQSDHLHRACRLWDRVDEEVRDEAGLRTDLLIRASEAAWSAGEYLLAVRLREEAVALVDPETDPVLAVRLRLPLHHQKVYCGLEHGPDLATNRALAELAERCPDTVEHCIALAHVAFAERWAGDAAAAAHADTAVRTARRTGSPEAQAWAIGVRSQTRIGTPEGLRDAEQAAAFAGDVGDPELLGNAAVWRANCLMGLGRTHEAADSVLAVFRRLVAAGSVPDAGWAQPGWAAMLLIEVGRWEEARMILRELLSHRLADDPAGTARASAALLAFRTGDERAGHAHLARARELGPDRGGPGDMLEAVEVQALWARGEHGTALTRLADMVAAHAAVDPAAADELMVLAARVAGDLSDLPGRRADAAQLLDRIEQVRGADSAWSGTAGPHTADERARGAVFHAERARCHGDPAAGLWEGAVSACADAGLAWDRALASYHHARALLTERGSRSRAATALRDAHRIATDLGASPVLADVTELARQARIPLAEPEPPADTGSPAGVLSTLTSREREVLSHVVAGRTYAEIAAALFISEKTVSVHVSNLLRKTGTSSRIEVADLARRASASS